MGGLRHSRQPRHGLTMAPSAPPLTSQPLSAPSAPFPAPILAPCPPPASRGTHGPGWTTPASSPSASTRPEQQHPVPPLCPAAYLGSLSAAGRCLMPGGPPRARGSRAREANASLELGAGRCLGGAQGSVTCSVTYPSFSGDRRTWQGASAGLAAGDTVGSTGRPALLGLIEGMSPHRTLRTQDVPTPLLGVLRLLPSFVQPPFPSNVSNVCPSARCVLLSSQLSHHRAEGSRKAKPVSRCCREEGAHGHGRWGAGGPSPCPVTVPGRAASRQPRGPAVPWCRLPWQRERQAPVVPSFPALSPSLPAFFSIFPPNTSLRNARGGGSTISHCEHLSLYCSARQNTAVPANKHPFIRKPQRQGIQGKCRHDTGPRQPPGPAQPPLGAGSQSRDGALCSCRHQGNSSFYAFPCITCPM